MTPRTHGSTRIGTLRGGVIGLLALAAMSAAGCEQALQVAPSSSVLVLSAPTSAVPLNGAVAITATLTESNGRPVADGTLVTFTATLGQISPNEARVSNGRASTTLVAGTTSGTATVSASSGSTASNALAIRIGSVPERIVMSATTAGTLATIVAQVFDSSGRAVAGVPVAFTTTAGTLTTSVVTTDAFGQAATSLFGTFDAVVTASYSGLTSSVAIRFGLTGNLAVNLTLNPTNPVRRANVTFTATAVAPGNQPVFVQRYEWEFSDGVVITTTGNTTARAFNNEGIYGCTVRVYTLDGAVGVSRVEFYVD